MLRLSIFLLLLSIYISGLSQKGDDERIAIQFYQFREYKKAELLLKKQVKLNPQKIYPYLFNTYLKLEKYKYAIDITNSMLRGKNSKNKDYKFNLGLAYSKNKDSISATKHWTELNSWILQSEYEVSKFLKKYAQLQEWGIMKPLILKFQKKNNKRIAFAKTLIDVYVKQGDYENAVDESIQLLDLATSNYMSVYSGFGYLSENKESMRRMDRKVFARLNKNPNSKKWNDIAMHMSMTLKDYEQALMLAKAFEKRTNGEGAKVLNVSEIALLDNHFDIAINGFNYLVNSGNGLAKLGYDRRLKAKTMKIMVKRIRDSSFVNSLNIDFLNYFAKYGFNNTTADIQLLFAEFTVKYLQRLDNAMHILEKLLNTSMLSKYHIARGKLDLADVKLALNWIWEASLLYGQVDKDEKDSPLGEEARFKNSKVFYYNGDYELAEDLLSILKSSTTELIANDALQLATFIQENVGEEVRELAMKDVSAAELLFYQNKPKEAFKLLNSLKKVFPNSELIDDVLIIEANYEKKVGNYDKASKLYWEISENYSSSILADRALYEWCILEEEVFSRTDKAQEGYLKLLTKYKDSVFTADSRKRLRKLRGEISTTEL